MTNKTKLTPKSIVIILLVAPAVAAAARAALTLFSPETNIMVQLLFAFALLVFIFGVVSIYLHYFHVSQEAAQEHERKMRAMDERLVELAEDEYNK
jgi:heme/copper-type cytochrome/quinol oxidase subunit 2